MELDFSSIHSWELIPCYNYFLTMHSSLGQLVAEKAANHAQIWY